MRILCLVALWLLASAASAHQDRWQQLDFDSDPALNQHFFLYQLARSEERFAQQVSDNLVLAPAQRQALVAAVEAYRPFASNPRIHILRSDTELSAVTAALMARRGLPEECPTLCKPFRETAAVYRTRFWPQQEQMNAHWVATLTPRLEKHGEAIAQRLSRLLQTPLVEQRHRVDLVPDFPRGATTSGRSAHTLITSQSEEYRGWFALEMLFHEVAHTRATGRGSPLRVALNRRLGDRLAGNHRHLWHALHFYTVGQVVKSRLQASGVDYETYAQIHGVYDHGWKPYVPLMEKYWAPYLNGNTTMEKALTNLVAALPDS